MSIKVEMWDKMQHIMARYNDHMVHIMAKFGGKLDTATLKRAFAIAIDKVSVLKSRYVVGLIDPRWQVIEDFDINDVFTFQQALVEPDTLVESKLLTIIKETEEAQIKIWQIRHDEKDTLAVVLNHMCFDGADTKVFMYYVAKVYNNLLGGGKGDLPLKQGSRSSWQVYENFTEAEQKEALGLISYSKKQKSKISFPFENVSKRNRYPKINKMVLDEGMFASLKAKGKQDGVSLNDIVLAAFLRATLKIVKLKDGETLGIPNMVDLRRYLPSGESEGLCNLVSMVVSNIGNDIGDDMHQTVQKIKKNMDELKGYYPGLHGLPLLKKVFAATPYPLAWFLIGTFFKNPLIGVSNIGIIDDKQFVLGGLSPDEMYMTGSVKYPPYMQFALSTFKNTITHTVAVYGTDADHKMFAAMFDYYKKELTDFIAK